MDGAEPPDEDDLDDLIEDLEELEEEAESPEERQTLRRTRRLMARLTLQRSFGLDDVAQQIVGGFILSAPFVVTEEVWTLAAAMNAVQWAATALLVIAIGYGALYKTTDVREAEVEEGVGGFLPYRFVSLIIISYSSVVILAVVLGAPATFGASSLTTAKAVSIGAVFSVVGAATADSLFG